MVNPAGGVDENVDRAMHLRRGGHPFGIGHVKRLRGHAQALGRERGKPRRIDIGGEHPCAFTGKGRGYGSADAAGSGGGDQRPLFG